MLKIKTRSIIKKNFFFFVLRLVNELFQCAASETASKYSSHASYAASSI